MNTVPARVTGLSGIVYALALLQCVLAPIPHVTALGNLATYGLLGCVPVLAYRRRQDLAWREPLVMLVGLLALYFLATSALGPYPLDSLNAWRKDLMPALLVFAALWLTVRSHQQVRAVLLAVAAGAAIRLALIAVEIWVLQRPVYGDRPGYVDPYTRELVPSAFYGGFALIAAIYSPLVASILARRDLTALHKAWLSLTALGTAVLVINYGSRTPVVTLAAGYLILIVTRVNRRQVLPLAALAVLLGAYVGWQKPEIVERYASIFSLQTYGKGAPDQALTMRDRLTIWSSIIEIADQRPLVGYGYGWKKLSLVVHEKGFLERWLAERDNDILRTNYFDHGYGAVNPHNLGVQLYFEGGWMALGLFGVLLALLARKSWHLYRRPEWQFRSLGILAVCFLAAWLAANVGNSLWAGEELPFVIMALLAVATPRLLAVPAEDWPRKILVVRRDNIGDLVCTTPLLTGLRRRFPDVEICVLANSYNAAVLRGNPDVDASFAYRKLKHRLPGESRFAAIWHRISLISRLRQRHFDLAILAKSGFDKHGLRFARQLGIRRIIGFAPPDGRKVAGLTDPLPARAGELRHEVEALADLVAPLGVEVADHPLTVVADPVLRQHQRDVIAAAAPQATRLVALHVSAREASRKWPAEKVVALIRMLTQESRDWTVVLMWAPGTSNDPRHPGDDEFARDILARCSACPVVPLPTQSLDELIAALSVCHAFIGADGGAMHVAAGVGLPVVGLFENSEFKLKHWHPWRVPHELVHADTGHAVSGIEPAAVYDAWRRMTGQLTL